MPTFGEVVKDLRTKKGLTQKEFAEALTKIGKDEITRSAVSMWEANQRRPIFETLETIADFFNVDMDYLLGKSPVKRLYDLQFFAGETPEQKALREQHEEINRILDRMPPDLRSHAIALLKGLVPPEQSQDDL